MRTALSLAAVLAATAAFGGCGDEPDGRPGTSPGTPARTELPAAKNATMRLVTLEPLNGSGVHGTARVLAEGRTLSVVSFAAGAEPHEMHMQHIHVPEGEADGRCPTADLDADGDGIVTLEEGAPAYGAPVVSLEPFPEGQEFGYANTFKAPRGLELDRGVIVLHGMSVGGKHDPLLPIACGAIDEIEVREVTLDPVNGSGVAGTARFAHVGGELLAWMSIGGMNDGQEHMQHIHLPEGEGAGSCPTPELDKDGDGVVSLEEGVPAYGAPAVSLEPFPTSTVPIFQYAEKLLVDAGLPLDRGVVVVHGMDIDGTYDATVPIACGAIDPTLPRAGPVGAGAGATGDYGG
jgi:hypothetical protein